MTVRAALTFNFVIAATTLAIGQASKPATQASFVTDPDAYPIYKDLLSQLSLSRTLPVQRETETTVPCRSSRLPDPAWSDVERSFAQENAQPKLLQPTILHDGARFISRAEIEADDARLAIKYPGNYQRRPESMDYLAVSAVGFNADKTRAMVHVRLRTRGQLHTLERQDGKWVAARFGCVWIA